MDILKVFGIEPNNNAISELEKTGTWVNEQGQRVYGYIQREGRFPVRTTEIDAPAAEHMIKSYFSDLFSEIRFEQDRPYLIRARAFYDEEQNQKYVFDVEFDVPRINALFKGFQEAEYFQSLKRRFLREVDEFKNRPKS